MIQNERYTQLTICARPITVRLALAIEGYLVCRFKNVAPLPMPLYMIRILKLWYKKMLGLGGQCDRLLVKFRYPVTECEPFLAQTVRYLVSALAVSVQAHGAGEMGNESAGKRRHPTNYVSSGKGIGGEEDRGC